MPRMEPAPGRLSTKTVCLKRFVSSDEMMRATTSVLPPGAHGTSRRTDFSGHATAAMQGAVMHARERARIAMQCRVRFMRVLFTYGDDITSRNDDNHSARTCRLARRDQSGLVVN